MPARGPYQSDDEGLVIGFVNNMPPAAVHATERQFRSLLDRASHVRGVPVRLMVLPACAHRTSEREDAYRHNENLEILRSSRLDGLIVTGSEPRAESITDEPIWPALANLVEWADDNTISTVWSCLAAHAAVYHLDGLSRRRLPGKLTGVFECTKVFDHDLLCDAPARWNVPHSRYNDLDEDGLLQKGYLILSRAPRIGADTVVKQSKSLFVFMQGHLEYSAESLLREYRRDVKRFLVGERDSYPEMPECYFDPDMTSALVAFRQQALRGPDVALLSTFDEVVTAPPAASWRERAVSLYIQWLTYLAEQKGAYLARPRLVHS
jgi:homoserine O-succinyltransferase/O-acetyltransferase